MPTRPPIHRSKYQPARADRRPTAAKRGYDARWSRLRRAHLEEHPFCVKCTAFGEIVDHIVPIADAPDRRLDPDNLRTLCVPCHNTITGNLRKTGVNEMPSPVQHVVSTDKTSRKSVEGDKGAFLFG